ncbi:UNVERIFIED_ORG: hypothetical protein QE398_003435 [Atlantibacter sp. SORGH_AS 304]|nr:hypothetical protein [Atlantibacter sp. SORGH_AS_0304]
MDCILDMWVIQFPKSLFTGDTTFAYMSALD